MKKSTISMGAISLCVIYGVFSWGIVTHSEAPSPEDSIYADYCSSQETTGRGIATKANNACCVDYHEALAAAKKDWQAHLKKLMAQERAASDMVEDAYESLRTYNCWMEYICRAVQYSSYGPIESALTGLRSQHLGSVPGCQDPENLRMESEYNAFVSTLKKVPILGVPVKAGESAVNAFSDIAVENKINYFPRCMTDPQHNNKNPIIEQVAGNYEDCKRTLTMDFNCPAGVDEVFCEDSSNAFVTVETALKAKNADQKAAALERKLGQLLPKMHAMEEHVNYLSNFLTQLNSRFSCYAAKCR